MCAQLETCKGDLIKAEKHRGEARTSAMVYKTKAEDLKKQLEREHKQWEHKLQQEREQWEHKLQREHELRQLKDKDQPEAGSALAKSCSCGE